MALFIVLALSLAGFFFVVTSVHEYKHVSDYEDYALNGEVCLMNAPTDWKDMWQIGGYYQFDFVDLDGNSEAIAEIDETSEREAYMGSFFLALVYAVVVVVFVKGNF